MKKVLMTLVVSVIIPFGLKSHEGSEYLVIGSQNLALSITQALVDQGKHVTLIAPPKTEVKSVSSSSGKVEVVYGAIEKDAPFVTRVAKGKKYIFFCPHFGFKKWAKNIESALKNVITAAQLNHAKIMLPSKLFSVGKNAAPISEEMNLQPCSKQGHTCRHLEQILFNATQAGQCTGVILRHGHPFGPYIIDGLMDKIFVNALKNDEMPWINQTSSGYQVAYAPNIAQVMVELAHKQADNSCLLLHYGGDLVNPVEAFLNKTWSYAKKLTAKRTNQTDEKPKEEKPKIKVYGKKFIKFFAIMSTEADVCKDIMYVFENTVALDDSRLKAALPGFNFTPLDEAIVHTLEWFANNPS